MPQPWTPGLQQKPVQQKQGAPEIADLTVIPQIIPASAQAASGKPSGKKRQAASGKRIRPSCKKDGGKDGCKAKGKGRKRPEQKAKPGTLLLATAKGKARGSVRSMRPLEPKCPPPAHLLPARAATAAVEVKEDCEAAEDKPAENVSSLEQEAAVEERIKLEEQAAGGAEPAENVKEEQEQPDEVSPGSNDKDSGEFVCDGCQRLQGVVADLIYKVDVLGQAEAERATRPWRLPNSSGSSYCLP